jgi:chromosome segregation protein
MKIKKLEIAGFKSFVDRTVIHFDHDVLGIVGPNGCGKSNIVDAIRWCMGEQSAKHLRGRSMEDVIFGGSESRPPHGFAEVTLTFENDRGDVPIEYREYAEIAVTRRLHRSGESEYLINKTPVRLKDVTDLFLGTGAGTKAYAIVEQGKIGLIVSAKPEDRRILIEEAAGITKFKSKKKQAEKKMELTKQNLLRVGDIVAEIDRNLGTLKRQAAKAERYLAYRKELEDLQLYEASHRFLELAGWIKLEASEVERLTLLADEARSALAAREAELEGVRLEAHAAEEKLDVAQNANFAAENAVRGEEAAIARAKDRLDALKRREAQAKVEAADIDAQRARLHEERSSLAGEVESLEQEDAIFAEQVAIEEDRLAEVTAEQEKADKQLHALRQSASRAQADIASAEAKLGGFERRRNDLLTRVERLRAERDELEGAQLEESVRVRELAQLAEDLRTGKKTSTEEKQALEARLTELRQGVTASERALDEAKGEFAKKRSRLHTLQEMQARLEGVGSGVKALLATKSDAIVGLVADRIEAPAELTNALAGLLGSKLQGVVVSDIDRATALLADLAKSRKGRATVVPRKPRAPASIATDASAPAGDGVVAHLASRLRFDADDQELVRALVGDAVVVTDVEAAKRLRAEFASAPIVTLDGTVFHEDGRVSGGQGEEVVAHMLDSKRETRELALDVERLEALVAAKTAEHHALRQSIVETQAALDRARSQAHQDELALLTAEKDLRQAEKQLETVRKRLEQLAAEQEDLGAQLQEAGYERDEARTVLDEARLVFDEAQMKLKDAEMLAASWREQVDARRQIVTERKVRMAGVREKLNGIRATMQRLLRSSEELGERAARLESELVEGARAFGESLGQFVSHKAALGEALDKARDAADVLAKARGVFETLRAQLMEREGLLKDLRTRAETTRDELTQHEMQLRERQLALHHLEGGVAEKFRGLELRRVIGDYHLRPPPDDVVRGRIAELSHLLERMGSVNLDAMREHEEAEKRHVFYSTQKADLEKALADLERAIAQMNRESRRLFQETFEAVNARFQELFPKMFRGGRASLRLTNPDDLLETGIDILAQPPGKKLSNIELMSGGEKALTAVSLIFAIFQIKPSPFCILDEVDAPLDEANVARYNEAIRSMTDRSQFILITHIKRTMQMVDVLYGVTMPEPGVSKLVSVKLNETATQKKTGFGDAAVA